MTTIKVREQEILEGRPCNASGCAVALAVTNVLKRGYRATVTPSIIRFYQIDDEYSSKDTLVYQMITPWSAHQFVQDYDQNYYTQGHRMLPIEFEMDIPNSLLRDK